MSDARTEAQKNEAAVFGANPARAADGKPLERGIGSPWHGMRSSQRAHYLAVELQAGVEAVINQANALAEAAKALAVSHKAMVVEAAKAKDEAPLVAVPADAVPQGTTYAGYPGTYDPPETAEQRTARLKAEQDKRDADAIERAKTARDAASKAEADRLAKV